MVNEAKQTVVDHAKGLLKVLVISSVTPDKNGLGGNLVLHRHLNLNDFLTAEVVNWPSFPLRLKIVGKLRQLGFVNSSRFWECLSPVLPPMNLLRERIQRFKPDLLLTVAHGYWHIQAATAAKEFKLPLITFFQDWWPDFPDVLPPFRRRVERQILNTCAASSVAICVSDGMLQMLGNPSNGKLIHDIPSQIRSAPAKRQLNGTLCVIYFGNLHEYGPPIEKALMALEGSQNVRLEVYGPKPLWTAMVEEKFTKSSQYHGMVPSDHLMDILKEFQAILVVMSFNPSLKRRMMSSFPSKLIEGAQLGLPIIIWGPEYCSAARWATRGNRALCVTDPNPAILRQALEALSDSTDEQQRLAAAARLAAQTDFNPDRIQAQFTEALRSMV